jgi:DnaJ-class molecular chaperone
MEEFFVVNSPKANYKRQEHHRRYKQFTENLTNKLLCQDCGGSGEWMEVEIPEEGSGLTWTCGWCEGTGLMSPYIRGFWLSCKKREKREQLQHRQELQNMEYNRPRGSICQMRLAQ